jgi:subtilisin family serine protease
MFHKRRVCKKVADMEDRFRLATGKNVSIAVLDDGIWPGCLPGSAKISGVEFVPNMRGRVAIRADGRSTGFVSHGTICAAIIANRVPNATIYSLKVKEAVAPCLSTALVAAIEWAVAHEILPSP